MNRVAGFVVAALLLLVVARIIPLMVAVAFWRLIAGLALFAVIVLVTVLLDKWQAQDEKKER